MFHPEEVIFAPTGRCNLACPHCRVSRDRGELPAGQAVAFLESCRDGGIERVGFSGGEPFLAPAFLSAVCKAAVDLGMLFDRLMTNGAWWKDERQLRSTLAGLRDAGFDGTFGLSHDAYHGRDPRTMAAFISAVFELWDRKDCVEILSVRSPDDARFLAGLRELAGLLGGTLEEDDGEPLAIVRADGPAGDAPGDRYEDGATLRIPILRSPRSAGADEGSWGSPRWFEDDFCAGPGNVFYVHPDGSVAACCGFANENEQLILGTMSDGYAVLCAAAAENAHVRACYETGLNAHRQGLETAGRRFPGKTADMCFFCDWLCRHPRG